MYRRRLWSARNAGWLRALCNAWENILIRSHPLFARTGYERPDRPFLSMARVREPGLHGKACILAGVGPLASARSAEWIRANVAGIHVPDSVIGRLRGAADQAREGANICMDMIHRVRETEGIHGVHIMACKQEHRVAEIVESTGILQGRTPWHPGIAHVREENRLREAG